MVDIEALKAAGLTNERLKQIFTAKQPAVTKVKPSKKSSGKTADNAASDILSFPDKPTDWDIRSYYEKLFAEILDEGMQRCASVYRLHAAADLAYESTPINKMVLPFLKLAQGYINLESCKAQISKLSKDWSETFFEYDKKGVPLKVNMPRLFEISHNLVHSLVTRRVAAVGTPVSQRFPFMKFESRSVTQVGKLRGDMMTQRVEIMADQYGYRHDIIQSTRDVSLYGHQVEFKRSAWDCEKQTLRKRAPKNSASAIGKEKAKFVDTVVREGVDFAAPHSSRVYSDSAEALAKINTDTGPEYIGYWDLARLGAIRSNKAYFNTEELQYDASVYEFISGNGDYFSQYYRDRIVAPGSDQSSSGNVNAAVLAQENDRSASLRSYSGSNDRVTTTLAQHFHKIVPSDFGIANYDHPVWLRFIVAGNRTVVYAEIVGSAPAVCYHYNESDGRLVSPTFAHQAIPYQDQISNLLTQLLEIQHQGFMRIWSLCTDGIKPEDLEKIRGGLKNHDYYKAKDIIIEYSLEKAQAMGQDPKIFKEKLQSVEISTREKTSEIFGSIVQLLSIAERLLFFSPQELGQVAPREITATEANMVNSTTLGIRDFHGIGIDEGLDAKKRIIFDSLIAFGSDEVEIPVTERYDASVVEAAGFKVLDDGSKVDDPTGRFTLTGDKQDLIHDYVFTSRDGFDRPMDSEEAKQAVTLLDVSSRHPTLNQIITSQQTVDLFNSIARKITGIDIKLRVPQGMDPNQPLGGDAAQSKQMMETIAQAIQQMQAQRQQDQQQMQALAQAVTGLSQIIQSVVVKDTRPTKKGTVSPDIPNGAPPLSGVRQPMPVPMLGQ